MQRDIDQLRNRKQMCETYAVERKNRQYKINTIDKREKCNNIN